MFMNKRFDFLNNIDRQDGITLLLGILVLSAILAISFSLTTILLVEVRSSGDLLRTETAYYGAQSVTEEALYKFKRQVPAGGCDTVSLTNCYSPTVGTVDLHSIVPFENPITDPIQQDIVPQGGSFSVSAKHYAIYNIACPAADPSKSAPCNTGGSGYGKIIVTYKNSGNTNTLHAYLCQFDPTKYYPAPGPCVDPNNIADNYWLAKDATTNNPGVALSWSNLDPSKQQELILFNPDTYAPIYIQIETFDSSFNPKGIPYFEQNVVDINAQNAGVNRKIRVLIPDASGGLVSSINTTNYAAAANGGVASASTEYSNGQFPASSAINGDRKGVGWGGGTGGWNDNTANDWTNEWLGVTFSSPKSLSEMDVYTLADSITLTADPGSSDTFTLYGITNFEAQYSTNNGAGWTDVPGGNITGNNLIWKKISFAAISGVTNVRVLVHNSLQSYSRIVQVEVY
jgi:hypothetical protein